MADHRYPVSLGLYGLLVAVLVVVPPLTGCSVLTSDSPPIPDSTFRQILVELHLSEARSSTSLPNASAAPTLRDSVFARYGVEEAEFDSTLSYYSQRPEAFHSLYESVVDTLRALSQQSGRSGIPETAPDSIR